ncbi:hypothetical protein BGZ65_008398, partial [Modicella reniformis]
AVNFVFLVESEFQTGGLQSEVDDGAWTALWRSIGRLNTPASSLEVVSEAHHWAHLASCNGYEDFVRLLDDTPPSSRALRMILNRMTATRQLWNDSPENEATFLKNAISPFLDAIFGTMLHVTGK